MQGKVFKGIGGFYYVDSGDRLYECKGKGILKKDGAKLFVGDDVIFSEVELSREARERGIAHEGRIDEVLPRKNSFIRPPIVNVDTFVITFACHAPEPNFALVDRFLVMAEMNNVDVIIAMNKCDLATEDEIRDITAIYGDEYTVIPVSCKTGSGVGELKKAISGKVAALAGPSGVGKSSLLNLLHPEANMETGEVSEKTERGRHTTRHVEIFKVEGGGLVYDTPGFTSFEIMEATEETLQLYYPEIERLRSGCYYDNCRHIKEPDCAVRQAVREGRLNKRRYLSYKENYLDIAGNKKY